MRKRKIVGLITLLCLGLSCSSTQDADEVVASSKAAITATSNTTVSAWSMTVTLPTWGTLGVLAQTITGQQGVSLGANSGAGLVVQSATTNKRRAVIAAGGPITVQPDAKVVDIVATGTVDLRDRVNVVGNVLAPAVTLGNNVVISGKKVTSSTPAAGDSLVWTASTPAGTVPGWDLQPGQTQTIAPGRYGNIAVKSKAKLILSATGRYFLESLDLEPGSTLQLPTADQSTEIYVHGQQLILRGKLSGPANIEERLAIVYAGTSDVFVEAPLLGAIIAPSANVILRSVSTPHKGSAWGKTVNLDAGAKLQPVAQTYLITLGGLSVEKCAWSIPPKSTGTSNQRKDEFQYQYELLRYCITPGLSEDILRLTGQLNYEASESGAAMYECTIQPSQYIGFLRRRVLQLAAAKADATLAHKIVVGPDSDGDWVPNATDHCASTPLWTPVDNDGCPLPLPGGPACSNVRALLDNSGLVYNPSCTDSARKMPLLNLAVAAYWRNDTSKGIYLYVPDMPNGVPGCEPWYQFEIRSVKAGQVIDQFEVAFPYSSASHTGSIVPAIPPPYVELRADPSATGPIGRLGQLAQAKEQHTIDNVLFRVQAVSGMADRGPWSGWHECVPQDCNAVGFTCAN